MSGTIEESLKKMSQEELTDLGFRLLVMPPEDRKDKQAWIGTLTQALMGPTLPLLLCLTMDEWETIRAYTVVNQGTIIRFFQVNEDQSLKSAVEELRRLGLCWRSQRCWNLQPRVMELLDAAAGDWQVVEAADQVYAAMQGYSRIYGMMPARDMVDWVQPLLNGKHWPRDHVSPEDFILGIWRRRNGLDDVLMASDGLWLLCPDMEDVEKIYAELHEPKMMVKPYAPYSLEEAAAIGHGLPPGRCDAYDELVAFYHSQGIGKEMALMAIDESVLAFQQDQMEDAMVALVAPLGTPPTTAQLRLMRLVFLRAPSWHLKGSCAEDMLPPGSRVSKRVRQDDPCPCGSGRKYKHCCGRLQ